MTESPHGMKCFIRWDGRAACTIDTPYPIGVVSKLCNLDAATLRRFQDQAAAALADRVREFEAFTEQEQNEFLQRISDDRDHWAEKLHEEEAAIDRAKEKKDV